MLNAKHLADLRPKRYRGKKSPQGNLESRIRLTRSSLLRGKNDPGTTMDIAGYS